jgi:hypothetical protein
MAAFADTGLVASLYLKESTSAQARVAIQAAPVVLPLTPLATLEPRNAFNRAVHRQRITAAQRDALWQDVEADIASGFLVLTPVSSQKCRFIDRRRFEEQLRKEEAFPFGMR